MTHKRKLSVIGLGYVGMTIATAFGQTQRVIGYDISNRRISELKKHHDVNGEISTDLLKQADIEYTTEPSALKRADFHIVAVLTPVNKEHRPDFSILLKASETIGKQLKKGDIVVYESTVYPGATEELCIPMLEKSSNLVCGKDFFVGYSPERVNPSDKQHTFFNIIKIVSAIDKKTLDIIADVYASVIKAGVHKVSSIAIAEATKVIENTQRDMNIAFINEIALILHHLNMDSYEIIEAAKTKWNFLPFYPGLVGGHCIGINSYYLVYKALEAGFHPDLILAGRRVNESMVKFIAQITIQKLIHLNIPIKQARVAILGLAYKENCPDFHDTRIFDLINEFKVYDVTVAVHDPLVDYILVHKEYPDIELINTNELVDFDAIIFAVSHHEYMSLSKPELQKMVKAHGLIIDLKGILNKHDLSDTDITFWRL